MYVYYHRCSKKGLETEVFNRLFDKLPLSLQEKALKYQKWQDRQQSVIGKIILLRGLQTLNYTDDLLHHIKYTEFQRPYIDSTIDFNISHSNDFTVCAISRTTRVGIDIEKCTSIDIEHFKSQFSKRELNQIFADGEKYHVFYKLWTKKEAFIKAEGTGLSIPLHTVEIDKNKVKWQAREWFLQEMKLQEDYSCHLCTSTASPNIIVKEIEFPL